MKECSRRKFSKSMAVAAGAGYLGGVGGGEMSASTSVDPGSPSPETSSSVRILFLGTGAADWPLQDYPGDPAPLSAGKFRGYSSVLINNEILVDCGPTVPMALDVFGINPAGLKHIVITHTHRDHFFVESLEEVIGMAGDGVNLWVETGAVEKTGNLSSLCGINPMTVGREYDLEGCGVLPLPANHRVSNSKEVPLNFLFNSAGKLILYALDGAWLTTPTWKAIQKRQLDAVIWDGTIGDLPDDYRVFAHNSLPMIRLMNQSLRANGVYKESTRVILSHMAMTLHPPHEGLSANLAAEGMLAAHDGMVVEI